jgi:hypothetical protein
MDILEVTRNWQRDGRWTEIEPQRDELMRIARRSGLEKEAARMEVYAKLLELYPQRETQESREESREDEGGDANPAARNDGAGGNTHARDEASVTGLSDVPDSWPTLPPNATLAQEISWVQANRLSVVRDLGERAVVDLRKAMSPAPSWAALGWLETSIRAYAKFVDVAAKASAHVEDERDMVRRERLAIDEIRGLLAEMLPDR